MMQANYLKLSRCQPANAWQRSPGQRETRSRLSQSKPKAKYDILRHKKHTCLLGSGKDCFARLKRNGLGGAGQVHRAARRLSCVKTSAIFEQFTERSIKSVMLAQGFCREAGDSQVQYFVQSSIRAKIVVQHETRVSMCLRVQRDSLTLIDICFVFADISGPYTFGSDCRRRQRGRVLRVWGRRTYG